MRVTLRLRPGLEERLQEIAAIEGRTVESVILSAVEEYVSRRNPARFGDLADETAERHAPLLDRLADGPDAS